MARILIVNDEEDLVEICALVLEDAGHEVNTLTEGCRATELAKRIEPHLIVLDWQLKDTTGEHVLRELRSEPVTARIPVLLISASPDGHLKARTFGFDGHLNKPFSAGALRAAVDQALRSRPESTRAAERGGSG